MELIDEIVSKRNLREAIRHVVSNKGAPGVDKMPVEELYKYFNEHEEEIREQILSKKYVPQPVRRSYIPKGDGKKKRPLGIPAAVDRVIQEAVAIVLTRIYDPTFSEYSYGFRPKRDCHMAIGKVIEYLNEGYDWVVDLDIEKYFDTVNHDKLVSILRERIKDDKVLHLIRSFLQAGVMEDGLVSPTEEGVPQGGPLSPILSLVYLDKFDKELEARGLRFVRYADDCNIFVRSRKAANRVMGSVSSWLQRKLMLKVNTTKTQVVRPSKSMYLGFNFWKSKEGWKPRPAQARKDRLCKKIKEILCRKRAAARSLSETFKKVNEVVRGWINYFRIGSMKNWLKNEFGPWMRHKVRVVILKQWKKPKTIYKNLMKINIWAHCNISKKEIYIAANSRKKWYKKATYKAVNFILNPKVLATPNKREYRQGLIDPLEYYLSKA